MSEPVDIEKNLPHTVSEVISLCCRRRWISVRPSSVRLRELECPGCRRSGDVIETGQVLEE